MVPPLPLPYNRLVRRQMTSLDWDFAIGEFNAAGYSVAAFATSKGELLLFINLFADNNNVNGYWTCVRVITRNCPSYSNDKGGVFLSMM